MAFFLADINGDEKADLISYNSSTGTAYSAISNGDGTFSTQIVTNLGIGSGSWTSWDVQIQMADFNGDGKADMLLTTTYYIYDPLGGTRGVSLKIRYGDGNAEFSTSYEVYSGVWSTADFYNYWLGWQTTSDVNGDGLADIAYITRYEDAQDIEHFILNVQLSTGSGATSAGYTEVIDLGKYAFADINDDGMADLIVGQLFLQVQWRRFVFIANSL